MREQQRRDACIIFVKISVDTREAYDIIEAITATKRCRTAWGGRFCNPQLGQHRTIPALRLKHRSGSCGTASALPKCSIMSGCGTRIVLRGQKPLALCDRCPCFGSLFPLLAALTFAASSIICAFGLAAAAPRSPYRHLELCGIALAVKWRGYKCAPLPISLKVGLAKYRVG